MYICIYYSICMLYHYYTYNIIEALVASGEESRSFQGKTADMPYVGQAYISIHVCVYI